MFVILVPSIKKANPELIAQKMTLIIKKVIVSIRWLPRGTKIPFMCDIDILQELKLNI